MFRCTDIWAIFTHHDLFWSKKCGEGDKSRQRKLGQEPDQSTENCPETIQKYKYEILFCKKEIKYEILVFFCAHMILFPLIQCLLPLNDVQCFVELTYKISKYVSKSEITFDSSVMVEGGGWKDDGWIPSIWPAQCILPFQVFFLLQKSIRVY